MEIRLSGGSGSRLRADLYVRGQRLSIKSMHLTLDDPSADREARLRVRLFRAKNSREEIELIELISEMRNIGIDADIG